MTRQTTIGAASWLAPARSEQPELLDQGLGTPADVAANLADMWHANRYLGGLAALTDYLYPRLKAAGGLPHPLTPSPTGEGEAGHLIPRSTVSVIDLGAGSAQVGVAIGEWAHRHNIDVRVVGVDWSARNLSIARRYITNAPQVGLLQADATRLPFAAQSVDYVISSQFLHHFAPDAAVDLLRSAFHIARRGIIMTDLVRGWFPLVGFRLIALVVARNFLSRHDGALSIRRAYTPAELRELAHAAELINARVYVQWGVRMTLVADK